MLPRRYSREEVYERAFRNLGYFRVIRDSVVHFNSIIFRVAIGVLTGVLLEAVALVTAIEFFLNALLEIPMGRIADKYGRVRCAILGFILIVCGLICMFLAFEHHDHEQLAFFLLVVDGFFLGIGKPLISGSGEAFYQNTLVHIGDTLSDAFKARTEQSLTISQRYGKLVPTSFVMLSFSLVAIFQENNFSLHYLVLLGASLYIGVSYWIYRDYSLFGENIDTLSPSSSSLIIKQFCSRLGLRALALTSLAMANSLVTLGYLVISIGRYMSNFSSNSQLLAVTAFMTGFLTLGWWLKASLLPHLVIHLSALPYIALLLTIGVLSNILFISIYESLSPVHWFFSSFIYMSFNQIVISGLSSYGSNISLSLFNVADSATALSMQMIPSYILVAIYSCFYIFHDGAPTLFSAFSSLIVVNSLGLFFLLLSFSERTK